MRVRLSGINDLIAAEGKYHLKCLVQFERKTLKQVKSVFDIGEKDTVMAHLCSDLEKGLAKGHVYDMGLIWNRYVDLSNEQGSEIPQRYMSRRKSFYIDIEKRLGGKANFVRPLDIKASLLMYPGDSSDYVMSHSFTKGEKHELFVTSGSESSEEFSSDESQQVYLSDTNIMQEMLHVALRLRGDLHALPGHEFSWQNIDQSHVEKVIPDSLYLFLTLLFGGTTVLESDDEEAVMDTDIKQKVCSIAQDIVFGMSNGKKLTPKHIGLALTLHQATRSESLVNVFHAANHCIPIWTVRAFDNAMANTLLAKYKQDGYVYIPESIRPGTFVHCSFDNIDLLEATIDGKNTFHSTQLTTWQRKFGIADSLPSLHFDVQTKSLDKEAMETFHKLDKAKLQSSHRQPSSYPEGFSLNMASWLSESSQIKASSIQNLSWILARNHSHEEQGQSVPLWGAFNESSSLVHHPITNVGMLPILQAPADDYDTVTTVINKFQALTRSLGQAFTVITADQPLYRSCYGQTKMTTRT